MNINSDFLKYKEQENYKAWKIDLNDFSVDWSLKNKIEFFLKFGMLAPSTHNTQPWIFEFLKPNQIIVKPNWDKKLSAADPNNRNLYISLGSALTNIKIAAGYHGYQADDKIKNKENKYFISLTFEESKKLHRFSKLAPFISRRFSDKSKYSDKSVTTNFLSSLEKIPEDSGFELKFVKDEKDRNSIGDLYLRIGSQYSSDPKFRAELSTWLKTNDTKDGDGMPGFVSQLSLIQSIVGKKLIKYLAPLPKIQVKKDAGHLKRGPIIGLIASDQSTPEDHIKTGELYQEIALMCTGAGLSLTPMTALIEKPESYQEITNIFKNSKPHPQMFFRLGYSKGGYYHTPRKTIEEHLY